MAPTQPPLLLFSPPQSKKRQYDQEVENLERQQKQTIERLEQEHTSRLRDEAKRIKAEQEKELSKFQNVLKNRKKEVRREREGERERVGVVKRGACGWEDMDGKLCVCVCVCVCENKNI